MDGKHLRETPAAAAAICRAFASCWVEARGRGFNAQNVPPSEGAACRPWGRLRDSPQAAGRYL